MTRNFMKKYPFKIFIALIVVLICVTVNPQNTHAAKKNVTVVIDPGHGGPATVATNLGAVYNGLVEKDMTLTTAMLLKSELEKYGNVTVYLTRNSDLEVGLKERITAAGLVGADAVVSVHFNAASNHLLYGSEIFVPSGTLYPQGASLAKSIMNKWTKAGMIDKGIKTRIGKSGDYYGIIRHGASAGIPTIILEHGYIDNYHDLSNLDSQSDLQRLAVLDAQGIADYFGLKKGTVKASVSPVITVKKPSGIVVDDVTPPALTIQVDSYNGSTGEVSYTLTGAEPESKLYLYGISTLVTVDENGNPTPLINDTMLWGNGNTVKGKMMVPAGYQGPINAVVFNNYGLRSNMATAYIGF